MPAPILKLAAASLILVLLGACGGGSDTPSAQPQGAQLPAAAAATSPFALTPAQVMDWAEINYAALFPATGKTDGVTGPYTYRHYPGTDNYIGITEHEAEPAVFIYGSVSGWQISRVGSVADFACQVSPQSCAAKSYDVTIRVTEVVIGTPVQDDCTGNLCAATLFCTADGRVGDVQREVHQWALQPGAARITVPDEVPNTGSFNAGSGAIQLAFDDPLENTTPPGSRYSFFSKSTGQLSATLQPGGTISGQLSETVTTTWSRDGRAVSCTLKSEYVAVPRS